MSDPRDETVWLLQRWHSGDRAALDALLRKHLPKLEEFVSSNLKSELQALRREGEARDLVQITAARVLEYVPAFVPEDGAQFQRLLRTFVRNEIKNLLRAPRTARRMPDRERDEDPVLDLRSSRTSMIPDRAAQRNERHSRARALVRMALEFLDDEVRRIVEMRQFGELGWDQIAAELDLQPDTVRMRYSRALPRLANHVRRLREGRIEDLLGSSGC